jgi:hypothetical protein
MAECIMRGFLFFCATCTRLGYSSEQSVVLVKFVYNAQIMMSLLKIKVLKNKIF